MFVGVRRSSIREFLWLPHYRYGARRRWVSLRGIAFILGLAESGNFHIALRKLYLANQNVNNTAIFIIYQ